MEYAKNHFSKNKIKSKPIETVNLLSLYLKVDPRELQKLNILDLSLPFDNRYFVDVFLMKDSNIPEFVGAYDQFMKRFSLLSETLSLSKTQDDKAWMTAKNMLLFKEHAGFHLGYSKTIGKGSGVGAVFAEQLLKSAKEILELDIKDPEAYLFIPFIENGIGCDRISDMACHILQVHFAEYTERILDELKVTNRKLFYIGKERFHLVPMIGSQSKPLLFVPKTFLRRLPDQFDWTDVFEYYSLNKKYRDKINTELSKTIGIKEAGNKSNIRKDHIKKILTEEVTFFKSLINDFIQQYPADIEMKKVAKDLVAFNPLDLKYQAGSDFALNVVNRICEKFSFFIEEKGAWKHLYKDGYHLNETYAQTLFHSIALSYCEANNLDLLPEVETGRGRVDFRMNGNNKKILVEIKLSTHSRLIHGYTTQIPEYVKSDQSDHCVFLVVKVFDFKDISSNDEKEKKLKLRELQKKMDRKVSQVEKICEDQKSPSYSLKIVNAYYRDSASKM